MPLLHELPEHFRLRQLKRFVGAAASAVARIIVLIHLRNDNTLKKEDLLSFFVYFLKMKSSSAVYIHSENSW